MFFLPQSVEERMQKRLKIVAEAEQRLDTLLCEKDNVNIL